MKIFLLVFCVPSNIVQVYGKSALKNNDWASLANIIMLRVFMELNMTKKVMYARQQRPEKVQILAISECIF